MIAGLECVLEGSGQPGLVELRLALEEVFGGPAAQGRLTEQQRLKSRVYRLRVEAGGRARSLIVKCLDAGRSRRNRLVAERWLPAVGLVDLGPGLLSVAAVRGGDYVWHVYQDLGDGQLQTFNPDPESIGVVVGALAQVHTRFAQHPLLAECRRYGEDFGIGYFAANVEDAIRGLESLRPPRMDLCPRRLALRDCLLERLYKLRTEQPDRASALAAFGGPETLLHGDLWTPNMLVLSGTDGLQARLIDWDHVGVGPVSYDLSTFLYRFPRRHRGWILERYEQAVATMGWRLPPMRELNGLFETAEFARYANRTIWPALALVHDHADWGFAELAEVESWFEALEPVLACAP
jgi:Phosphotransferase enzyme family